MTKGAIAENIMNLTKLSEAQRSPSECVRCPALWLALASLCVLDTDHVERLSSAQWRSSADGNPPPPRVSIIYIMQQMTVFRVCHNQNVFNLI